jgi:hypothetical protein
MFGELALSERAIADHSILTLGSATSDANFTLNQAATYIGVDAAEMSAIAIKLSVGSGILTGLLDATLEFTQSSALTRFATGVSAQVVTAVQATNALYVARGISDQDAQFIQDSAGLAIVSGISEQDANFTESASANMLQPLFRQQRVAYTGIIGQVAQAIPRKKTGFKLYQRVERGQILMRVLQ